MRIESFATRKGGGNRRHLCRPARTCFDDAAAFLEIANPQRRGKSRRTGGGQYMIWTGAIIAKHFTAVCADKNRTGVADFFEQAMRAGGHQ